MTVSLLRSFRLRGRSDGAVSHQQRLWRVNESVTTAEQGDGFSLALFGRNPTNNHLLNVPNFTSAADVLRTIGEHRRIVAHGSDITVRVNL